ncbi:rRNA maturation RNase YbeY [Sulfitobacter sp. SK012]|nr:rRNA maturation RNase YbeY [Sulfitobacter sp. SK012]AXI45474.1 rRNA maturation RNase YbeY [Sulfitobacter sp. SK012]
MQIELSVQDHNWNKLGVAALVEEACAATLAHQGLDSDLVEIGILACDDAKIAVLNADFRGKATPTNVLSWPSEERGAQVPGGMPKAPGLGFDGMIELGDIAISFDTCDAEARAAGKPLRDHATHLIVHGLMHLLGYDHISDPDAALMERLEAEILGKLGLNDPYRE